MLQVTAISMSTLAERRVLEVELELGGDVGAVCAAAAAAPEQVAKNDANSTPSPEVECDGVKSPERSPAWP